MIMANNKELAENKLMLLYIIDRMDMAVSNLQITKIVMENKFMNYFVMQQFLNELHNDKLLTCSAENSKTYYAITQSGRQLLAYFPHMIPSGIKMAIDKIVFSIKKQIKTETKASADYEATGEDGYVVSCNISEGSFTIVDIKLTVGTKEAAAEICDNWEKHTQSIYSEIMDSLVRKRE